MWHFPNFLLNSGFVTFQLKSAFRSLIVSSTPCEGILLSLPQDSLRWSFPKHGTCIVVGFCCKKTYYVHTQLWLIGLSTYNDNIAPSFPGEQRTGHRLSSNHHHLLGRFTAVHLNTASVIPLKNFVVMYLLIWRQCYKYRKVSRHWNYTIKTEFVTYALEVQNQLISHRQLLDLNIRYLVLMKTENKKAKTLSWFSLCQELF